MKTKYYVTLLLFSFLLNNYAMGQDNYYQPPQLIDNPRVAAFQLFGNYPVSLNTGVPDISIPLYTIHSDGIDIPITLKYHTGNLNPHCSLRSSNL